VLDHVSSTHRLSALLDEGGLGWVAGTEPPALAAALRSALDDADAGYAARALAVIAPFRRAAVDRVVAEQLLPALVRGS